MLFHLALLLAQCMLPAGAFIRVHAELPRPTALASAAAPTIVRVGRFEIRSVETEELSLVASKDDSVIQMQDVASGWGNGLHPTTRLCLDFVLDSVRADMHFLDYGTGSGILSILAMRCGAKHAVAVDIDDDSLRAAQQNVLLNGLDARHVDVVHTRHVYVGEEERFPLADVTVANILPGPLSRLVAPLWGLSKPGGLLCLSGMRPAELAAIRSIYLPFVDVSTEQVRQASHVEFGDWVSWSVRFKVMSEAELAAARDNLTERSME